MKLKNVIATLILTVILASVFSVSAYALPSTPVDVTIYFRADNAEWASLCGNAFFVIKDDSGKKHDAWAWLQPLPEVVSDRDGYAKYHFTISDWGESPEDVAMYLQVQGNALEGGYVQFDKASIPFTTVDKDNKLVFVYEYEMGAETALLKQENTPAAAATVTAPAVVESTTTAAATTNTTPSKSPATSDNDIALGFIVIVSGAFVFGLRKKLAKNN